MTLNKRAELPKECRSRCSQHGAGKLTLFVFGAIIAAVLYTAYHVLPFYYYYYELKNHMAEAIRVASVYTDEELRKKIAYQIKWMEIPADPAELEIVRMGGTMRISLSYDEVFYARWMGTDYELHTFHFEAEEEGEI